MRRFLYAIILGLVASTADARPIYLGVYKETFPEHASVAAGCQICHPAKDRKLICNEYGKRFEEKLSGKNVKDIEEIRRILRELGPLLVRPKDE